MLRLRITRLLRPETEEATLKSYHARSFQLLIFVTIWLSFRADTRAVLWSVPRYHHINHGCETAPPTERAWALVTEGEAMRMSALSWTSIETKSDTIWRFQHVTPAWSVPANAATGYRLQSRPVRSRTSHRMLPYKLYCVPRLRATLVDRLRPRSSGMGVAYSTGWPNVPRYEMPRIDILFGLRYWFIP